MKHTRMTLALMSVLLLALVTGLFATYLFDIRKAHQRVSDQSLLLNFDFGAMEYTRQGAGIAVLVIHGAGGGYDQGELIAQTLLDDTFDAITPSRFGYLGSTLPENATWDTQADAYALAQASADRQGNILRTLFQRDFPYWLVSRVFQSRLLTLLGANSDVLNGMTVQQHQLAKRFIDEMNPASLRAAGVIFDNQTTLPGNRISLISAPTLLVHAKDDTLQLYRNAVFATKTIPDAQLMSFEQGGHLVTLTEQSLIKARIRQHITENNE
jgi:2-hydroxy-6-oxonona-2,4-dienedioate hydrolase